MSQAFPFQYLSHSQYTLLAMELEVVHLPWPEQLFGHEFILLNERERGREKENAERREVCQVVGGLQK